MIVKNKARIVIHNQQKPSVINVFRHVVSYIFTPTSLLKWDVLKCKKSRVVSGLKLSVHSTLGEKSKSIVCVFEKYVVENVVEK